MFSLIIGPYTPTSESVLDVFKRYWRQKVTVKAVEPTVVERLQTCLLALCDAGFPTQFLTVERGCDTIFIVAPASLSLKLKIIFYS